MLTINEMQSMGGKARAASLTAEQRSEAASAAANARWSAIKATHKGTLKIGNVTIPCAVLEDGRRVLTDNGITNAILGSVSGASKRLKKASINEGAPLPIFLAPIALKPLISDKLRNGPLVPIQYLDGKGLELGYEADILPSVCEIWLKAREGGLLQSQQLDKALKAEIMMRSLAHVGITALVDEATGYQYDRARDALAKILEKFISKELQTWTKTFPLEFYEHIFRLKEWPFDPESVKRPAVIGHYTNDIVYKRLAPGVLSELREKNPVIDGRRKHKLFQWLTGDIGHPKLRSHIDGIIALMRISDSWDQFRSFISKAYPIFEKTELGFEVKLNK